MKNTLRLALAGFVGLLILSASGSANAKLFDLYASLKGGGITGSGLNTLNKVGPDGMPVLGWDYFEVERGPVSGFEVGAEVLFLDFSIVGYQFFDVGRTNLGKTNSKVADDGAFAGTLFEFLVGIDFDVPLDSGKDPSWFLRLGANAGIGLGLHRRVVGALSNDEVASKGFMSHAIVALDYHINDVVYLGAEFLPGYHIFVPGGDNPVNDNSAGTHYMGFLSLQIHIDPMTWGKQ
jgi:hypothetical protein